MTYMVKEMFYSLQGEGAMSGRPAVFCRFAGCNLWSGREEDRTDAECSFCDTDFTGTDGENGGRYTTADDLATKAFALWPGNENACPFIVLTGGEPALQLDAPLINALHGQGFMIAVETNGTLPLPDNIDWITVSPKGNTPLAIKTGDEIKLVYPQNEQTPEQFESLEFIHYFLQPLEDKTGHNHTSATLGYCLKNPKWRLSLQIHKFLRIK